MKRFLGVILVWFLLSILAIVNGTVRNFIYKPLVGDLFAHQISTLVFICIILGVVYLFLKLSKFRFTRRQLWFIGSLWLLMTVLFEFGFGHFVMHHPWQALFHDYNIFAGRTWILVLFTTLAAPAYWGSKIYKK